MKREVWIIGAGDVSPRRKLASDVRYSNYHVFLSYYGGDLESAVRAGKVIASEGLAVYIDRLDPKVDGDTPTLEIYLRKVIRDTPILLALVTNETEQSWWVPFEIGVARQTESRLATRVASLPYGEPLPSYLYMWPVIRYDSDLRKWAKEMKQYVDHGIQFSNRLDIELAESYH